MNKFQERYKSFDNQKLLKIIEEAEYYQPIAVEAAKIELSKREVSNYEIQMVKHAILADKAKIEKKQEHFKKLEQKAKLIGVELLETVSPIQKKHQTIDRKINLIVIFFGIFALYQFSKEFGMLYALLTASISEWDLSILWYCLPILMLPVGVYYFWKRKKIGWILLSAYFVYNISLGIGILFLTGKRSIQRDHGTYNSIEIPQIKINDIENLFPEPNPIELIIIVACYGAVLWAFNKEDMIAVFQINLKHSLITISLTICLILTIMSLLI